MLRDTFIETDGENHKHRQKNSDVAQKKGDESIYVKIIVNYFGIAARQGGRIIAVVATTIIVFVNVVWQVTGRQQKREVTVPIIGLQHDVILRPECVRIKSHQEGNAKHIQKYGRIQ